MIVKDRMFFFQEGGNTNPSIRNSVLVSPHRNSLRDNHDSDRDRDRDVGERERSEMR